MLLAAVKRASDKSEIFWLASITIWVDLKLNIVRIHESSQKSTS